MYIYKITVLPINQSYIGLDTKPSYKMSRWKGHQRDHVLGRTKLHRAMLEHGLDQCKVEIVHDNVPTIGQLALLEIQLIDQIDTYRNGLNSTLGGDGLGRSDLLNLSNDDIVAIKAALGERMSSYNQNVKWAGTTLDDRKALTSHLHTLDVYRKKSDTLKKFYKANPQARQAKKDVISKWRSSNPDALSAMNKKASEAAAQVNRQRLRVETEDGNVVIYESVKEFKAVTKQWPDYIIKKTKLGQYHNGYKVWRI